MAATKRKKSRSKSSTRKSKSSERQATLVRSCHRVLGAKVVEVAYPGGRSRESYQMLLDDGRTVIATQRKTALRAQVEAVALRALNKHAAPAPELLGTDGSRILFQEALQGQRLSLLLKDADEAAAEKLLDSALEGLAQSQEAGSTEDVENNLPELGGSKQWLHGLVMRPAVFSESLELSLPELDIDGIKKLLRVRTNRFVKWDSRPGNALVTPNETVHWFDWEHAGKRNRLDDLVWLLCDEFVPDYPDVEARLLSTYVPRFEAELNTQDAFDYVYTYGVFHTLVRLGLVLSNKGDGEWWDEDYCIDKDKVGITLQCAQRLCSRASRWAGNTEMTRSLSPWFDELSERIVAL